MKKWILLFGVFLSFGAYAETSGTCGPRSGSGTDEDPYVYADNCQWTLDDNGKLTITGTGDMGEHEYYDAPWGRDITEVSISGISSIATHAFVASRNLTKVDISDSVTSIGLYAFEGCYRLSDISLSSSLSFLGEGVFSSCSLLKTLVLPDSLFEGNSSLSTHALSGSNINNLICSPEKQSACQAYLESALESYHKPPEYWLTRPLSGKENIKVSTYTTDGDKIFYQNRWYSSANDIISGNYIPKRIYTIDEANAVAGKVNRFSIKYK